MEVGRNLLSSPPSFPAKAHLKNSLSSSSSVLMLHDQAAPAITSIVRHLPTSVLVQEQRDDYKPPLNMFKDEKIVQATLDGRQIETRASINEEKNTDNLDQLVQDFERQLLHWPALWSLLTPSRIGECSSSSLTKQLITTDTDKLMHVEPHDVVSLAKEALSASMEAALLASNPTDLGNSLSTCLEYECLPDMSPEKEKTVRSTRRLERQNKRRRVRKPTDIAYETYSSRNVEVKRKTRDGFSQDPLRFFLWNPETKQLLTAEQESDLVGKVQDLLILEGVKSRLRNQFDREPTLVEWAEAVGISCSDLQSQLRSGNKSKDKLIYANLRLVVHIAKQYQGRGLSLQDLLQEGSMGLMKSVEKFKPLGGCRFSSYAYWWIRQTTKKAIYQHSRTIRLPESIYALLGKVMEAKRSYAREGNYGPSKEEIARHVGITVDKLDKLLVSTRKPMSLQKPIWADQDTTFQEVTADMSIETPETSVAKKLMRQHVRHLLRVLNPRERRIIRLRFGIDEGERKTLSEIGTMYGLCKERVRQVESRALSKLKKCLSSEGLEAYVDLLAQM
ncbi:RNA polymerase sigma factor sigF, chloroplastic isoform X2 [Tripterygium wilfordii]|uniref:RNA polymerase sigma factor sigF, chloroplastic isoform X2 n=1 Tax=Tripterygium wilfordii TaxID=458696 RepID=UPI0018F824A3|nr:RNA polymerase sigma factor sigF, chloroplastic isoform X2 [Tripterygium wilfordii]